jgi:uncharacterized short protein YbdD (DUF466 family)
MPKEKNVSTGDMVTWNSSGGSATGKVEEIKHDGSINVPDSKFTIEATEDDPAVLIRIYRNGKKTDTLVGHKMSTLRKNMLKGMTDGERLVLDKLRNHPNGPLSTISAEQYHRILQDAEANGIRGLKGASAAIVYNAIQNTVKKNNSGENIFGIYVNAGHDDIATGIAPNGNYYRDSMDEYDLNHAQRTKRKMTLDEQQLFERITSPAKNNPFHINKYPEIYNLPFSDPQPTENKIHDFVQPFSGVTEQPGAGGM